MKLIIAGGRDYQFTDEDIARLDALNGITEVVCGMAKGADSWGKAWADENEIRVVPFWADWDTYKQAAGPIRNEKMARYADAVVLFPGGNGTESMFQEATKAGLIIFDWRT